MKRLCFIFLAFIILMTNSCSYPNMSAKKNMAYLYYPNAFELHPLFSIQTDIDSIIHLHYKLNTSKLFVVEDSSRIDTNAFLNFQFEFYNDFFELTDTSSLQISHENIKGKRITGFHELTYKPSNKYLYINTFNTYNQFNNEQLILLDSNIFNYQFKVKDYTNIRFPKLWSQYYSNQTIDASYLNQDSIYIDYHKPQIKLYQTALYDSVPINNLIPDTSFWHYKPNKISLADYGKYYFRSDSIINEKVCYFNFGNNFPLVNYVKDIYGAIQYIATDEEYYKIINSENPKLSYDNFWLNITEELVEARFLIKIYNSRLFYSNIFFTSDKEGWKTDRGMIYIVYGLPDDIKIKNNREIWYYGNSKRKGYTKFEFEKQYNECSNNDFKLIRQNNLNSQWTKAVETWRNGNVYQVNYNNETEL